MAFNAPVAKTPTTIRRITVTLSDRAAFDNNMASQSANYELVVLDQNGQHLSFTGDAGNLIPHITIAQRNALMAFLNDLRAQAETQILGG
jgi:hypothetical protein